MAGSDGDSGVDTTWKAVPVRHGYTNSTERVPRGVHKTYEGPDFLARADAEFRALSRLTAFCPYLPSWTASPTARSS